MNIEEMIGRVKARPDFTAMGMIACHLGVVRENSLSGKMVEGVDVDFDKDKIEDIISDTKKVDGIIEVLVEVSDGRLNVGDDIMAVVVGGDTREHVFPALISTVDRIKAEAVSKKEIF